MPWACHSGILEPYIIKCGPHFPTSLIHIGWYNTDDLYKFLVNLNLWSACKHQKHYWENVLHLCYHRRRHCVTIAGRSATNSTWVCSECNVHWIVLDFFGQHPAEVGLRMALISRLHPENVSEKIQIEVKRSQVSAVLKVCVIQFPWKRNTRLCFMVCG